MQPEPQAQEDADRAGTADQAVDGCAALLIEDSAVARHIFKHLDPQDLLLSATLVCRQWRRHTRALCVEWKEELAGESELSVSGLC
eukprot:COSAG02_NODE_5221_length_4527_cov_1.996613_3_plen_86_part_00